MHFFTDYFTFKKLGRFHYHFYETIFSKMSKNVKYSYDMKLFTSFDFYDSSLIIFFGIANVYEIPINVNLDTEVN
jgi:hypothetical protein